LCRKNMLFNFVFQYFCPSFVCHFEEVVFTAAGIASMAIAGAIFAWAACFG
jgi:hypothetical protein